MKKTNPIWHGLRVLPFLIVILFFCARIGQGAEQYTNMTEALTDTAGLFQKFQFAPFYTVLSNCFTSIGWNLNTYTDIVINVASYEILILLMQILYEVIAFLPKFCIKVINREKEKTKK